MKDLFWGFNIHQRLCLNKTGYSCDLKGLATSYLKVGITLAFLPVKP